MKVCGIEVHALNLGKSLAQALRDFNIRVDPVLIIEPLLVLVITEDGAIVGAGKLSKFTRNMSKSEARLAIGSLPKFRCISFDRGIESLQAQIADDKILINASGLLKLGAVFEGRLKAFLSGNELNAAESFMLNVAEKVASGQDPATVVGSQVRYSIAKLDRAAKSLLGVQAIDPTEHEIRRLVDSLAERTPVRRCENRIDLT